MLADTQDPLPRKVPLNLTALRYDQSVAKARFSQSQNSNASSRLRSKVMRFSANMDHLVSPKKMVEEEDSSTAESPEKLREEPDLAMVARKLEFGKEVRDEDEFEDRN
jgi:hypothetical protein